MMTYAWCAFKQVHDTFLYFMFKWWGGAYLRDYLEAKSAYIVTRSKTSLLFLFTSRCLAICGHFAPPALQTSDP